MNFIVAMLAFFDELLDLMLCISELKTWLFFLLGCEVKNGLFDWTAPLFSLQVDTKLYSGVDTYGANRK